MKIIKGNESKMINKYKCVAFMNKFCSKMSNPPQNEANNE